MRHRVFQFAGFVCLLATLFLCACSPAQPAANPNLVWTVSLSKFEVKERLQGVKTIKQYNGSVDEVIQQAPGQGNVYLMLKLTVSKQGTNAAAFEWGKLAVRDADGKTYARSSNDSFIEQYKYTPRMTGLEIKFGSNEGWVCYEIPAQAAGGPLTLVYSGEGSQQEVSIKK